MLGISSLGCFFWTSLCRSMLPWPGVNFLLYDLKQVKVLFWSLTGRSNLQPSVPLWSCPGLHINFLYTWCPWKIQWILFICLLNYNSSSHPLISKKTLKMYPQSMTMQQVCIIQKFSVNIFFTNVDHSSWPNAQNCKVQNPALLPVSKHTSLSTDICAILLDIYIIAPLPN